MGRGRHYFRFAVQEAIIKELQSYRSLPSAVRIVNGPSYRTIWRWIRSDRYFRDEYHRYRHWWEIVRTTAAHLHACETLGDTSAAEAAAKLREVYEERRQVDPVFVQPREKWLRRKGTRQWRAKAS